MKLLFCPECLDVFAINYEKKYCDCKHTWGRYVDNLNAIYAGEGIPLGFTNVSFTIALSTRPKSGLGKEFKAFVIPEECETFKKVPYES